MFNQNVGPSGEIITVVIMAVIADLGVSLGLVGCDVYFNNSMNMGVVGKIGGVTIGTATLGVEYMASGRSFE